MKKKNTNSFKILSKTNVGIVSGFVFVLAIDVIVLSGVYRHFNKPEQTIVAEKTPSKIYSAPANNQPTINKSDLIKEINFNLKRVRRELENIEMRAEVQGRNIEIFGREIERSYYPKPLLVNNGFGRGTNSMPNEASSEFNYKPLQVNYGFVSMDNLSSRILDYDPVKSYDGSVKRFNQRMRTIDRSRPYLPNQNSGSNWLKVFEASGERLDQGMRAMDDYLYECRSIGIVRALDNYNKKMDAIWDHYLNITNSLN